MKRLLNGRTDSAARRPRNPRYRRLHASALNGHPCAVPSEGGDKVGEACSSTRNDRINLVLLEAEKDTDPVVRSDRVGTQVIGIVRVDWVRRIELRTHRDGRLRLRRTGDLLSARRQAGDAIHNAIATGFEIHHAGLVCRTACRADAGGRTCPGSSAWTAPTSGFRWGSGSRWDKSRPIRSRQRYSQLPVPPGGMVWIIVSGVCGVNSHARMSCAAEVIGCDPVKPIQALPPLSRFRPVGLELEKTTL